MALLQRLIDVVISTRGVDAPASDSTIIKIPRLRTSCRITKAGGQSDCTMNMRIFGLSSSLMNRLSTFGMILQLVSKTTIVVSAGDAVNGMSTVFTGDIVSAFADFQSSPIVAFNIVAHTGFADAVIAAAPSSFKGSVDVATVMQGFATKMGLKFENSGVNTKLSDSYFPGTIKEQARAVVRNAGIAWNNGDGGTLAIWPMNGSRGGAIPEISARSGLVGYPTFTAYGLMLKTVFNPALVGIGNKIKVVSSIEPANAEYSVYSIDHDLESLVVGGQWFSTIGAYNPLLPQPIPNPVES